MRVVVAGAGSALGKAVCRELTAQGHQPLPVTREDCDLADLQAVTDLAAQLGAVDGLLHLVGGWRGGKGLGAQSDEDWRWLEERIVTTLRNTTRAFLPALKASPAARVAIVSTTGLEKPSASNANYLAAKAAAEAWLGCVGRALDGTGGRVHVERVMALVSADEAAKHPEKDYSRHTDVDQLAAVLASLFTTQGATDDHTA